MLGEPDWSPTGDRITLIGGELAGSYIGSVFVLNLDSSKVANIVDGTGYRAVRWSADGDELLTNDCSEIYSFDYITSQPSLVVLAHGCGADWSPDQKQLAIYKATIANSQVAQIRVADSANLADGVPIFFFPDPETARYGGIDWSPDGRQIAFAAGYQDQNQNIVRKLYIYDLQTRTIEEVPSSSSALYPRWSPDGRWLVYVAEDVGLEQDRVVFVAVDGSCRLESELSGEVLTGLAWSPTGEEMALTYYSSLYILKIGELFGSSENNLTRYCE